VAEIGQGGGRLNISEAGCPEDGCSNWKWTPADSKLQYRRYAGTCSRCDEDERRRWRPGRSATLTSWSSHYQSNCREYQNCCFSSTLWWSSTIETTKLANINVKCGSVASVSWPRGRGFESHPLRCSSQSRTPASVIKQFSLTPTKGWWYSATGKVTAGELLLCASIGAIWRQPVDGSLVCSV